MNLHLSVGHFNKVADKYDYLSKASLSGTFASFIKML